MESRLIKRVKASSIVVGECWEWIGRFQRKSPVMSVNSENTTVRRALWLDSGQDADNRRISVKCGNWRCVNPEHLNRITHAAHLKAALASPKRAISLSMLQQKRCGKVTDEQVREIQSAHGTQAEIAQRYGVSQSFVSAVKLGKKRRLIANPWAGLGSRS